ncbi:MAG TPA: Zn-ribbon domain-containing OB-fold protein [Nitrososphaerales archaeon]|nr:Zn-ribbon domain-containing OB-fold protein [Nitrososphaerales archaeon]
MPLTERLTDVDRIRFWKDKIPFRYEYTAGVAGEKFLRGLQEGRIIASRCTRCGRKYVPAKSYCAECFMPITRYGEVGPEGTIAALTESHVRFDGTTAARPRLVAFVTFRGATGGIVHQVSGKDARIGSKVEPRFRAKKGRKGSLLDIEEFRVVRG